MENMEDSGIDSDQKSSLFGSDETSTADKKKSTTDHSKVLKKASDLQKKIEKHRDKARKVQPVEKQPRRSLLPLHRKFRRLNVPSKGDFLPVSQDERPLVAIVSDDSDSEFEISMSRSSNREITQQLIKDGYNLDLEPDDEDLDLIPPRPMNERCHCCDINTTCAVQ